MYTLVKNAWPSRIPDWSWTDKIINRCAFDIPGRPDTYVPMHKNVAMLSLVVFQHSVIDCATIHFI